MTIRFIVAPHSLQEHTASYSYPPTLPHWPATTHHMVASMTAKDFFKNGTLAAFASCGRVGGGGGGGGGEEDEEGEEEEGDSRVQ